MFSVELIYCSYYIIFTPLLTSAEPVQTRPSGRGCWRGLRYYCCCWRTTHPNNITLDATLPRVRSHDPAKREVDGMSSWRENRRTDVRTEAPSILVRHRAELRYFLHLFQTGCHTEQEHTVLLMMTYLLDDWNYWIFLPH